MGSAMFVVFCNCPPDQAASIARAVVEERLAACVNLVGPVTSIYEWQGAVETATETTLILKVPADKADALRARLRELHPYDVPEILALPVDVARSEPAYVAWVRRLGGS
jgi:periplasmic divalent cation tolerance protein